MLATFQIPPIDPAAPLWGLYDTGYGITLNEAAVAAPNDWSSASWTKQGCTVAANVATDPFGGATADRLTDDATGNHGVFQSPTGWGATGQTTFSVYAKAGTITQIYMSLNSNDIGRIFNLNTGTLGPATTSGGPLIASSITDAGNGWYLCSITAAPAANQTAIFMASGNTFLYTGSGAGTVFLYGASILQQKVSQWTDQSLNPATGALNGHDLIQAVAAKQMLWIPNGWNGRPVLRDDGVDDFMQTVTATLNQPWTLLLPYVQRSFNASGTNDIVADGFTALSGVITASTTALHKWTMYAGTEIGGANANNYANTVGAVVCCEWNGASSAGYVDNGLVIPAANPGATNPAGFTLGALSTGLRSAPCDFLGLAIFSGVMSAWSRELWTRYFMAKYHPSVMT